MPLRRLLPRCAPTRLANRCQVGRRVFASAQSPPPLGRGQVGPTQVFRWCRCETVLLGIEMTIHGILSQCSSRARPRLLANPMEMAKSKMLDDGPSCLSVSACIQQRHAQLSLNVCKIRDVREWRLIPVETYYPTGPTLSGGC